MTGARTTAEPGDYTASADRAVNEPREELLRMNPTEKDTPERNPHP